MNRMKPSEIAIITAWITIAANLVAAFNGAEPLTTEVFILICTSWICRAIEDSSND